jgi:hypothetical protein
MTDVVNVGTSANDGTGDTLRAAMQAINAKFAADSSWLDDTAQPNMPWIVTAAEIGKTSTNGSIGLGGAARTSDSGVSATAAAIGLAGFAWNDNTTTPKGAWGGYFEAKRSAGGVGWVTAVELDATNNGIFVDANPYTSIGGASAMAFGAWIASGGDITINPSSADATAGIGIVNNGAKWGNGILFASDAIRSRSGTDGSYAQQRAITMAQQHGLVWVNPDGNRAAHISSICGTGEKSLGLAFGSTVLRVVDDTDYVQLQIAKTASATSFLSISGSTGATPTITAASDSVTDVSLVLAPKNAAPILLNGAVAVPTTATVTGSTATIGNTTVVVSVNYAGTCTVTLPTASAWPGRMLNLRTITANTVVSASSNVVPLAGGAASTAILAATAGKWAQLQSDGTNWQVIAGN